MARWRITNTSKHAGSVLIDHGNEDWPDNPPRQKAIAAGASMELSVGTRGFVQCIGFEPRLDPVAKNPSRATREGTS